MYNEKTKQATYRWRKKNYKKWRDYTKNWYASLSKKKKIEYRKTNVINKRLLIASLKDKPCVDCKKKFPLECMDFDHVRGKKKNSVAHMAHKESYKAIVEEIDKCEVVCSNCHRTRTHKRKGWK